MFPFENLPFGHGLMNIPELKNNVHSAENSFILQFTTKVYLKTRTFFKHEKIRKDDLPNQTPDFLQELSNPCKHIAHTISGQKQRLK